MDDFPFNILDTIIVTVIALSALIGLFRGLVREVLSLAAWIGAAWVTLTYFNDASTFTQTYIEDPLWAGLVGGAALFILSLVVLMMIARALAKVVSSIKLLGPIDWTLGFGFGVLRGAVIVSLTYLVTLQLLTPAEREPDWVKESRLLPHVQTGATVLQRLIPSGSPIAKVIQTDTDSGPESGYTPDKREALKRLIEQRMNDETEQN